jgi:hypothetical protein
MFKIRLRDIITGRFITSRPPKDGNVKQARIEEIEKKKKG